MGGLGFSVVVALPLAEGHVWYTGKNTRESIRWLVGHTGAPVRGLQQRGNHVEQPPLQHPTTN